MFKNNWKLAIRNLTKYPAFSLINIAGLSIGIAASFVLLLYSNREMNCDAHFQDAGRIARIGTDFFHMGGFARSQAMLKPLLQGSCTDVQYATSLDRAYEAVPVRSNDQDRAYSDIYPYYIDAEFFKVFSYQAVAGFIPPNGLAPEEAILTESEARRFFGKESPVGKTLLIGKEIIPFKVVAVLKESFEKSHLHPTLLLPLKQGAAVAEPINWSSAALYTYVKLKPQGSMAGLQRWLDRLLERVVYPSTGTTSSFAQWKDGDLAVKFMIQPLKDIYFHSDLKFELSPGGDLTQVKILCAIGIFLILLAIINYVNLVTAHSSVRSREIGVKKTFGASRKTLIGQFIGESLLFSFLAMILAAGLIRVILFIYQSSTGYSLMGTIPWQPVHYAGLFLFSLAVGLLAGIYPAFYFTALKPLAALRSLSFFNGKKNPGVRNALVLLQFTIATGLVFASLVVYAQLQYMRNKDKGFRSDGVVLVENAGSLKNKALAFQQLVESQSQVLSTSFCYRTPGGSSFAMGTYQTPAMTTNKSLETFHVDAGYIPTLRLRLVNGRNFDRELLTDTNSLILNESAVAALGLFQPIGATINGSERVIGVVKDFNYASLKEKIGPVVLRYSLQGEALAIRISGGHTDAFLDRLQEQGKDFFKDEPIRISFLDDNFAKLAAKDRLLGSAITFFTILAILLAILGLIGLTLFTIERRIKEFGIRKVLGAGIPDILRLVSHDFVRLAAVSSLIALPLSSWLVHRWLESFAYRVSPGIGSYLLTCTIIMTAALSVITLLTLRAAIANPVKNLRSE